MNGKKCLVGRYHMAAGGDGILADFFGNSVFASDQFKHNIGLGLRRHHCGVVEPGDA